MHEFNIIDGLEAVDYSWSNSEPRQMRGTATGETETLTYTGRMAAMKAMANAQLWQGSQSMQVRANITRMEGGMAKLSITRTYYGSGSSEDPEHPGGAGVPAAGEAGSSEANPLVSFDYTEVQQPILTHPLVVAMGLNEVSPQWIALRMLSQGADLTQTFNWSMGGGEPMVYTVEEGLQGVPSDVQKLVGGQQFYLDVIITASVKYEIDGASRLPAFGNVPRIEAPPNVMQLTGGRDWLFCGGGISLEGGRVLVTKVYKSSGAGGWDPKCYSGQ